jgi:tetratricopeptide (TPR) repeat protein
VTGLIPFRRLQGAALAAFLLTIPASLAAQAPDARATTGQGPTPAELARITASGSYLAARHASAQRDSSAASAYYRAALKSDPRNSELLERAFLSVLADGELDEAFKLAERLLQLDKNDRIARLVVGVRAIRQKHYGSARQNIAQSVRGPITDLTATLLTAWSLQGAGDVKGAIEAIDKLTGPDWYAIFKDLHAGLILDVAGHRKEAGRRFEKAHKVDSSALRVVDAYGRWATRNATRDEALKIYQGFDQVLPRHPLITDAMEAVRQGHKLPPLVDSTQAGAAEVLYGLGASLGRRGGEDLGLVYLQLALSLAPQHPLALLSLADLYEHIKKPQQAIKIYERVPAKSPLRRNADIQAAVNLDSLDRTEEAKQKLEKLIATRANDLEAIMALGTIQRGRKQFADCAESYGKAVELIAEPKKPNWLVFYFRGICYERSKQWPKAEADLKKALELYPDEPHVLNYLGYSWIDQGMHLDEGMRMIQRAVEQRPDDGYIVDSLGWAHYRLNNYEEAVKHLERAVELRPDDPTINDHLGDAYWRVGRVLEAEFQWSHARDLKPEPDELPKIEEKLKYGLKDEPASAAAAKKEGNGG